MIIDKETNPVYKKKHDTTWLALCECGNFRHVTSHQITSGSARHCGCKPHRKVKDLTGKRFGKLEVIGHGRKDTGKFAWKCQCDCGDIRLYIGCHLQSGKQTDCGCVGKEKRRKKAGKTLSR